MNLFSAWVAVGRGFWYRLWRLPLLVVLIVLGILMALVLLRPGAHRSPVLYPTQWWFTWLGRLMGLSIRVRGEPLPGPVLIVANHISWLDIACIITAAPSYFLAKSAVREWPLFGWLTYRAGTLFIRRGGVAGAAQATEQMVWRLQRGERLVIFPEGTSTDGREVRRFFSRLFQAAIHAQCPVQAVAVRYPHRCGVNPVVPFVGEDSLVGNLWRLLGQRRILVELDFQPPIAVEGRRRDELAVLSWRQVEAIVCASGGAKALDAANRLQRLH